MPMHGRMRACMVVCSHARMPARKLARRTHAATSVRGHTRRRVGTQAMPPPTHASRMPQLRAPVTYHQANIQGVHITRGHTRAPHTMLQRAAAHLRGTVEIYSALRQ
eukprot:1169552-Pleurochrysis_carterae.AAC.2